MQGKASTNENETDLFSRCVSELRKTVSDKSLDRTDKPNSIRLSVLDENSDLYFKMSNSNEVKGAGDSNENNSYKYFNLDLGDKIQNNIGKKVNPFRERLLKNDNLRPKPIRTLIQELKNMELKQNKIDAKR